MKYSGQQRLATVLVLAKHLKKHAKRLREGREGSVSQALAMVEECASLIIVVVGETLDFGRDVAQAARAASADSKDAPGVQSDEDFDRELGKLGKDRAS